MSWEEKRIVLYRLQDVGIQKKDDYSFGSSVVTMLVRTCMQILEDSQIKNAISTGTVWIDFFFFVCMSVSVCAVS